VCELVVPITKLLQKSSKFQCSDECEVGFQELKKILASSPVLALPEGSEGFMTYSDMSIKRNWDES